MPDATTLLKFRHKIGEKIFADVNKRLYESGFMMHEGTIVDASIITAPISTKNLEDKRDLEIHQTKKSNEWYFETKVRTGVYTNSSYVTQLLVHLQI